MRIQTKLSAIFIAASLIPMLALYALLLDNARSMLLGHLESSQKKLIQYHTRQLSDAVTTDASILVGASHFPSVQGIIRSYSDATESVGRASLQQWKRQLHSLFNTLLETHSEVIQLDYVHQSGETLVSETRLKEMSSSQFTVSEALLARAQLLSKGEVAIQHRRGESMELATPVFDERSPKAPIFGFIILTLDFEQLVSDGLGDTESESLLLVDEDGYILWGHQLDALLSEVSHESYFNLQPEFYEGVKGRLLRESNFIVQFISCLGLE